MPGSCTSGLVRRRYLQMHYQMIQHTNTCAWQLTFWSLEVFVSDANFWPDSYTDDTIVWLRDKAVVGRLFADSGATSSTRASSTSCAPIFASNTHARSSAPRQVRAFATIPAWFPT